MTTWSIGAEISSQEQLCTNTPLNCFSAEKHNATAYLHKYILEMQNISLHIGWHKVPELEVVYLEVAIEKEQNDIEGVSAFIHIDALGNSYIPAVACCYERASAIPT